jgi:hypothetical protein
MTVKAEPELGPLLHKEASPTAASAWDRKFGPSGAIKYRVMVAQQGGARAGTIVEASTGDEAAEKGLLKYPGWKVVYVGPVTDPDAPRLPDEVE